MGSSRASPTFSPAYGSPTASASSAASDPSAISSTHRNAQLSRHTTEGPQYFRLKPSFFLRQSTQRSVNSERGVNPTAANELESASSGMVGDHVRQIVDNICVKENTVLIFRPTSPIACKLIEFGFATKSMDIKGKSGFLGFIPADQAFSKQLIGAPTAAMEQPRDYGEAKTTQLSCTEDLLNYYVEQNILHEYLPTSHNSAQETNDAVQYFKAASGQKCPDNIVFKAELDPSTQEFKISWLSEKDGDTADMDTATTTTPFWVWGYSQDVDGTEKTIPVTGDYDLYMIAPGELDNIKKDTCQRRTEDIHGTSTISQYGQETAEKANKHCERENNPVIWHGAETQNDLFAQPLDESFVVMTPGGSSRLIAREEMPKMLAELAARGYYIKRNPAYLQDDLMLGGYPFGCKALAQDKNAAIKQQITKIVTGMRQQYQQHFNRLVSNESSTHLNPDNEILIFDDADRASPQIPEALEELLANKEVIASLAIEDKDIPKLIATIKHILVYSSELNARLEYLKHENAQLDLHITKPADFPADRKKISDPFNRNNFIEFILQSPTINFGDVEQYNAIVDRLTSVLNPDYHQHSSAYSVIIQPDQRQGIS
jgi:hypothetical protein